MTSQRILVMGDNHGDTDSLERVVEDTAGETFDYIIHVGDITNGIRDGAQVGFEQIQNVKPYFETLTERGSLLYIYGNRDLIPEEYELGVGTHIPSDGGVTVGGQRFTQDPDDVGPTDILVTHYLFHPLLDHFAGRAYFSGHVHTGRYKDRSLNSAFLYRDGTHGAEELLGGYFIVEVTDDSPFEVEFRNLGRLERIVCHSHYERGVLFAPDYHSCQFCHQDGKLEREMAESAFHGLSHERQSQTIDATDLVEYALDLFDSPPTGFRADLEQYLKTIDTDQQTQLTRVQDQITRKD